MARFDFTLRNGDIAEPLLFEFFEPDDSPADITANTFVLAASSYGRDIIVLKPGAGTTVIAPNKLLVQFGMVQANTDGTSYRTNPADLGTNILDIAAKQLDYGIKRFVGDTEIETILEGKITIDKKRVSNEYN